MCVYAYLDVAVNMCTLTWLCVRCGVCACFVFTAYVWMWVYTAHMSLKCMSMCTCLWVNFMCMWLLSEEADWWWGMERIRNTLGWEWGVSRRVALAQNTTASHIITLIPLMRTTLRATNRLDSRTQTQAHEHKAPQSHRTPHRNISSHVPANTYEGCLLLFTIRSSQQKLRLRVINNWKVTNLQNYKCHSPHTKLYNRRSIGHRGYSAKCILNKVSQTWHFSTPSHNFPFWKHIQWILRQRNDSHFKQNWAPLGKVYLFNCRTSIKSQ